ncbi:glycosyltransferase [Porticoccaceae bacterium]|nr:glycosyltransferase [Porticoccaceae bacterium]
MTKIDGIPKIIHQIWLGPLEPPREAMETWQRLHPEWEYMLWTEENLPALKNQQAFDRSKPYTQKADILRYELLYHHGGIFVDADEVCLKEITPLYEEIRLNKCDCFAVRELEGSELIANGIMGCTAGNAFMGELVDGINVDRPGDPWELVGPKYLTDMIARYAPAIHIFKSKVFLPIHYSEKHRRQIDMASLRLDPEIYGVQLWGTTTSGYKPTFFKSPRMFIRYWLNRLKKKQFTIK